MRRPRFFLRTDAWGADQQKAMVAGLGGRYGDRVSEPRSGICDSVNSFSYALVNPIDKAPHSNTCAASGERCDQRAERYGSPAARHYRAKAVRPGRSSRVALAVPALKPAVSAVTVSLAVNGIRYRQTGRRCHCPKAPRGPVPSAAGRGRVAPGPLRLTRMSRRRVSVVGGQTLLVGA